MENIGYKKPQRKPPANLHYLFPYLLPRSPQYKNTNLNQFLSDNISDVIWLYNIEQGKFTYISPSVKQLRGYSVGEALDQNLRESIHEDDFTFVVRNLNSRIHQFEAGNNLLKTLTNEIRQTCKNNEYVWVEVSTTLIKDKNGKVSDVIGVTRDISQRKKEQTLVKDTQSFFETAFNLTATGMALINEKGSIINVNGGFCKMIGFPKNYVLQKSFYDFVVPGDESCVKEIFDAASKEKIIEKQSEIRLQNIHGQILWGLLNITGVKSFHEKTLYWVIQLQETTGKKKAEDIIRQLNTDLQLKNREMEQLIYVTSHDLRSPLVNIRGFNKELENSFTELKAMFSFLVHEENAKKKFELIEKDIIESFEYITLSISKMDKLLGGLLKYSRLGKQMSQPTLLPMTDLIANVIKTHEYVIKKHKLDIELLELPDCYAIEEMINQAFSNLLENAIKYLDPSRRGHLKISGWEENNFAVYCLEDNGIGIQEQHKEKVFELFYRLQPHKSKGEGLGLSTVKKIMDLNFGKIKLESTFGVGSKFFIYLPIADANQDIFDSPIK